MGQGKVRDTVEWEDETILWLYKLQKGHKTLQNEMQLLKQHQNDKLESSWHYPGHLQISPTLWHYTRARCTKTGITEVLRGWIRLRLLMSLNSGEYVAQLAAAVPTACCQDEWLGRASSNKRTILMGEILKHAGYLVPLNFHCKPNSGSLQSRNFINTSGLQMRACA